MAVAAGSPQRAWQMRKKKLNVITMNVYGTKYPIVQSVAKELGMSVVNEDVNDSTVYWVDSGIPLEKFLELKPYQKINHYPGIGEITRKDLLARNMQKMRRLHKEEYSYVPRTWVLPAEYGTLSYHMRELKRKGRRKILIIKPHNGAMGNGIFLTSSLDKISKDEQFVAQEYLERPFLLDGFKCDLRIYVLLTDVKPPRIFLYRDGLVRLSTQEYNFPSNSNLDQQFMHLTNYSVNKHSKSFDKDERTDKGSKRTVRYFMGWLRQNGYDVERLWSQLQDLIIKTIFLAHPHLVHAYQACRPSRVLEGDQRSSQCFEILGFDILLDEDLKPWLLEVNRSPSFSTDSKLDAAVKSGVLRDALKLADIRPIGMQQSSSHLHVMPRPPSTRRQSMPPFLPHTSRTSPFDCLLDQEDSIYEAERKKKELKERLAQLRIEREREEYEELNMGDYVRIYPTRNVLKMKFYNRLIQDSARVSLVGRSVVSMTSCTSKSKGCIQNMQENEVLELLMQYEDEEAVSFNYSYRRRPSTGSYQSLALQDSSPMEAVYTAMAIREFEEEQTQRTMIALNSMKPFYPGKSMEVVEKAVSKIQSSMEEHHQKLSSFWLTSLDNCKRKQLLTPVREKVKHLMHLYWKTSNLESIRLNRISSQLFNFLLLRGGQGLISTLETSSESFWQPIFKKRLDIVLTVAELVCCRRIVELCKSTLIAAYSFHQLAKASERSPSSAAVSKSSSLPNVSQKALLTCTSSQSSRQCSSAVPPHHSSYTARHCTATPRTRGTMTILMRRHATAASFTK